MKCIQHNRPVIITKVLWFFYDRFLTWSFRCCISVSNRMVENWFVGEVVWKADVCMRCFVTHSLSCVLLRWINPPEALLVLIRSAGVCFCSGRSEISQCLINTHQQVFKCLPHTGHFRKDFVPAFGNIVTVCWITLAFSRSRFIYVLDWI